jgi:hypothetical protein
MQMKLFPMPRQKLPEPLCKIVAFIATAALVGVVLVFSAVLFAIILTAGAIAWAYLWWKAYDLRKQIRDFPSRSVMREDEVCDGDVIEGEVVRVVVSQDVR